MRDVYCYFDNTDKVHAPRDALSLRRRLSQRQAAEAGSTVSRTRQAVRNQRRAERS